MDRFGKAVFWSVSATALSLGLSACGDETTNNVTETTGMTLVEKGERIPNCTDDNAGQMVYATDSAAVFYCAEGEWQSLDGKDGARGEKGDTGEQGPMGEPGESCTAEALKNGSGYRIVCGGDSVGVVLNGQVSSGAGQSSSNVVQSSSSSTPATPSSSSTPIEDLSSSSSGIAYGTLIDSRDDQTYKTVTIGTQTWMAENLNYETANSWCYDDVTSNCATYGRLYTWAAAMDSAGTWSTNGKGCGYGSTCSPAYPVRGVCPSGWHLPTKAEFETLFTAVGGSSTAGTQLKSTTGWNDSGNGIDAFGFSALPAGYYYLGYFSYDGYNANFWSSTEYSSDYAYFMYLYNDYDFASLDYYYKDYGFSVRCLRD